MHSLQQFIEPNRISSLLNIAITKNVIVWLSLVLPINPCHVGCSSLPLALHLNDKNNELQQNINLCLSMLTTIMLM